MSNSVCEYVPRLDLTPWLTCFNDEELALIEQFAEDTYSGVPWGSALLLVNVRETGIPEHICNYLKYRVRWLYGYAVSSPGPEPLLYIMTSVDSTLIKTLLDTPSNVLILAKDSDLKTLDTSAWARVVVVSSKHE